MVQAHVLGILGNNLPVTFSGEFRNSIGLARNINYINCSKFLERLDRSNIFECSNYRSNFE